MAGRAISQLMGPRIVFATNVGKATNPMDWERCGSSENDGLNTGKAMASAHENPMHNDSNMPEHSLLFLHSLPLKSTKSRKTGIK